MTSDYQTFCNNMTHTFRLKIIYNLTHSILVILVLFLKFFNPFLEKSIRHFKTEKHLTFFDGVYIVSMKQFHKESVEQASSPYNKIGTHLVSSRCGNSPYSSKYSVSRTIEGASRMFRRDFETLNLRDKCLSI